MSHGTGNEVSTAVSKAGWALTHPFEAISGTFSANTSNRWIVDGKTFNKKYVSDSPGVFRPAGGPMNAYSLEEPVQFTAPWGEPMYIRQDGYLLQDPTNLSDIYGISGKDFNATYRAQ